MLETPGPHRVDLKDAISLAIHFFIEALLIISLYFHQYKKEISLPHPSDP